MPPNDANELARMIADLGRAADRGEVLDAAVRAFGSEAEVALLRRQQDGSLTLPPSWHDHRPEWVTHHELPGDAGTLVLAWEDGPAKSDALEAALAALDIALARHQVQEAYDDLVARVDNAQHLADMGDYDWHIASNTNRWSDQLYRIYGYEPQSFNASYERFLEMVHPDDRERIVAVHQEAYRTGEPYQMIERIVRPDGEIRHLASNGQVVMDASGTPLRFRGTCIDITERVRAEDERERLATQMVETRMNRRQALELNDSVVQGLTAATYALELGDVERAASHLAGTMAAARDMMGDLLQPIGGGPLRPGDLVRSSPAGLSSDVAPPPDAKAIR